MGGGLKHPCKHTPRSALHAPSAAANRRKARAWARFRASRLDALRSGVASTGSFAERGERRGTLVGVCAALAATPRSSAASETPSPTPMPLRRRLLGVVLVGLGVRRRFEMEPAHPSSSTALVDGRGRSSSSPTCQGQMLGLCHREALQHPARRACCRSLSYAPGPARLLRRSAPDLQSRMFCQRAQAMLASNMCA